MPTESATSAEVQAWRAEHDDHHPVFAIEAYPTRETFATPPNGPGGFLVDGATAFEFHPDSGLGDADALWDAIDAALDPDRYELGELLSQYNVLDAETECLFQVGPEGDDGIVLHVKTSTDPAAVAAFHARLETATDTTWAVTRFETSVSGSLSAAEE